MTIGISVEDPIVLQYIEIFLKRMQVIIENGDEELEDHYACHEQCHLKEVPQTHGLEPDLIGESVGSHLVLELDGLVEASLLLKVLHVFKVAKLKNSVAGRTLKDGSTHIYLALPLVLDDAVGNLGLHGLVQ